MRQYALAVLGDGDAEPRGGTTLTWIFIAASLLAGAWIGVLAYAAAQHGPTSVGAFVVDYDGRILDDGLELLIVQSDGQAFATLARDPLLRRPESFRTNEEAAYRAQRPLLPWIAAVGSLGQSGWVPPALAIAACLGTGAAAAGIGGLLRRRRRTPWIGLSILLFPGTGITLSYLGPEPLVLGLLAWGVVYWERERPEAAVALFTLAVLGRETAIIVPAVLGGIALWRRRWHLVAWLAAVPVVLFAWFVVLWLRVGAWPWEAGEGRIGMPFVGLVAAVREGWIGTEKDALYLSLPLLLVIASVVIGRTDPLTLVVLAHAAFGTLLGKFVWEEPDFYPRVLLPMYAFAVVAVAGSSTIGRASGSNAVLAVNAARSTTWARSPDRSEPTSRDPPRMTARGSMSGMDSGPQR